ncbi:MAG: tetratricopeptide repeat protein [Planctomycetota bacterium]
MDDRERDQRLYEIYRAGHALTATERRDYLIHACAGDEALRAEVESLLRVGGEIAMPRVLADSEIDRQRAIADALLQADASVPRGGPSVGEQLGDYRLVRQIGRGGMGAVYEAEQASPRRTVALKVIGPSLVAPELLRRFRDEAEVLGRMQHPGIAQVYEAGTFDRGAGEQPFFAMELVDGASLTEACARQRLDIGDRVELMAQICDAVQHAHQRGVIHRDLKPGNILVNRQGQPKVLDFGIARTTDRDVRATTMRTDLGQLIGTIPYMSPEQAAGDPRDLDVRSDVYALGVIAYELLTGRRPYDVDGKLIHEAVRVIREQDPTPISAFDRSLRGDLATIVDKALAKEKDRRYSSAAALADDLRRFLRHEPIAARPPSTWYQLQKFTRRNKTIVGGVAATFVALVVGLAGTLRYARLEAAQRVLAQDNETAAKSAAGEAAANAALAQRIADFQASRLRTIDLLALGKAIGAETLAAAAPARRAGLETEFEAVNLTTVAREVLGDSVFEPTIRAIDEEFATEPRVQAQLHQSLANALLALDLNGLALEAQERALATRRELLGNEDAATLESINAMASLRMQRGELHEAETVAREAVAVGRQRLGDEHPETLSAMGGLGNALYLLGHHEPAKALLEEAVSTQRRVLGDDHPDTVSNLSLLAGLRKTLGDYDGAEAAAREVLAGRQRRLGDDDEDTLRALGNLADVQLARGRTEEAEATLRRVHAGLARLLGTTHDQTWEAAARVASCLIDRGELGDAEALLEDIVKTSRRLHGEVHPTTTKYENSLGIVRVNQGRLDEAEALFRGVLAKGQKIRGDAPHHTLRVRTNLGQLLTRRGRPAEAEKVLRTVLREARDHFGDEHIQTHEPLSSLAVALKDQGRFKEAEAAFRDTLRLRQRWLGDRHPDTVASIVNLGYVLGRQGRWDEALPFCLEAAAAAKQALGDHPFTVNSLINLAIARRQRDEPELAEPVFREAVATARRVHGEAHPQAIDVALGLAFLLLAEGRLDDAAPRFLEVVEIQRRERGDEHPATLAALSYVVDLRRAQGRLDEAEDTMRAVLAARRRLLGPDDNGTHRAILKLGQLLHERGQFAEAAELVLELQAWRAASLGAAHPSTAKAIQRLADLYDAWHASEPEAGHDAAAARWRAKLPPEDSAADG